MASQTPNSSSAPSSRDEPTQPFQADEAPSVLARLLDDYLAELQAGRRPDRAKLLADHPGLAGELDACLAGLDFIHRAAQPVASPPQIGDFRIVREIGRGGMGVVYEAEQLSLRRRVALKVLKFGGTADAGALERFQREAETVAHLHHTNIVPIFAVGCEAGVHYYAMQLIAGRSLAEVARDAGGESQPTFADVARWSLEAAEALAHAHQRGVIHRDIKPSNILLDNDGRIWLTDFGLARRQEEATLTVTGALMGTPRYMSPEQAGHAKRPIDHRTDIYSLGATLYEMATRQPIFEADTPLGVLTQILDREPIAPRKLAPDLPRDLETIILKCVAKNPGDRYATARELADDLRRFLAGDPIRARRAAPWERARRWIRKRRRSAGAVAAAAAVAAGLAVAAVAFVQQRTEARKGALSFATTGPHFKAELLDTEDRPIGVSFTVPNDAPVRVDPGEYRAQLSRDGVLSETVELSVEPSSTPSYDLDLSSRELWPQVEIPQFDATHDGFAFVNFGDATDLVLLRTWRGLSRVPGRKNADDFQDRLRWEVSWQGYYSGSGEHVGAKGFGYTMTLLELMNRNRYLAKSAPRLNNDAFGDLVFAGELGVVAINGDNGRVLWHHPWLPQGYPAGNGAVDGAKSVHTHAFGRPIVERVNDDATADLIVTAEGERIVQATEGGDAKLKGSAPYRWVAAVDGKNGRELWRRDELQAMAAEAQGATRELPLLSVVVDKRPILIVRDAARALLLDPKTGRDVWPPIEFGNAAPTQFTLLDRAGDGRNDVLFWVAGERIGAFDLRSGQPAWQPPTLDFRPVGEVRVVLKPTPLLLVLKETGNAEHELRAYRPGEAKPAWKQPLRVMWPKEDPKGWSSLPFQAPVWPLVAERSKSGGPYDVIVPNRFSRAKPEPDKDSGVIHLDFDDVSQWWAGVSVFDAATGGLRWQRQFPADAVGEYLQLDFLAAGPDIDGDGFREVFVAAFGSGVREAEGYGNYTHRHLYVTCLAGNDGRELWWWRQRVVSDSAATVRPLKWWQLGPDGLPLLMVSYDADASHTSPKSPSATYFLRASTGKVEHTLTGVGQPTLADLDGDGVLDLYSLVRPDPTSSQFRSEMNPRLFTMKGTLPTAWKRFGKWSPGPDVNGDGVADAIEVDGDAKRVSTVDGRTGRPLWSSTVAGDLQSLPADRGDLDGDGVVDMATRGAMSRAAVSMKTGRVLWQRNDADVKTADAVGIRQGGRLFKGPTVLRPFGDRRDLIVFDFWLSFGPTAIAKQDEQTTQLWLAGVDGATGDVVWRTPLGKPGREMYDLLSAARAADLDGDGAEDLVVLCAGPERWSVRGLRGRDGQLLWERELKQPSAPMTEMQDDGPELVVDASPGKLPRILVVERDAPITAVEPDRYDPKIAFGESAHQILLLDPRDGTPRILWRGPVTTPSTKKVVMLPYSQQATLAQFGREGKSLCAVLARPHPEAKSPGDGMIDRVVVSPTDEVVQVDSRRERLAFSSTVVLPSLLVGDVDGDGFDELLWGADLDDGDYLVASRGKFDLQSPLWKRYENRSNAGEIIASGPGRPALVTLYESYRQRFAVDGRSGQVVHKSWPGALLRSTRPGDPLRFLRQDEGLTTCYVTGPSSTEAPSATRTAAPLDPRLATQLPWAGEAETNAALHCGMYALLLLALPLFVIGLALRRRRWRWVLLLPIWGGGVVLAYYRGWLPGSLDLFGDFGWVMGAATWLTILLKPLVWLGIKLDLAWLRAILGLPMLGIALGLYLAVRRFGWRGAAAFFASVAVASTIAAVATLRIHNLFDAQQYYTWEGAYRIVGHGAFYVGLLSLIVWLLVKFVAVIRAGIGRLRRRRGLQVAVAASEVRSA